jgi:hypothetical protein
MEGAFWKVKQKRQGKNQVMAASASGFRQGCGVPLCMQEIRAVTVLLELEWRLRELKHARVEPSTYSQFFKNACLHAYSYAYDDSDFFSFSSLLPFLFTSIYLMY